jgi:hypothetical protein
MTLPEAFLDWVQVSVARQAFNCCDLCAIGLHSEHCAGFYRFPINKHRASAADAGFTSHVRASQSANITKILNEQQAWLNLTFS